MISKTPIASGASKDNDVHTTVQKNIIDNQEPTKQVAINNSVIPNTAVINEDSVSVEEDKSLQKVVKKDSIQHKESEKKDALSFSRWSVRLSVSPDFSSVKFFTPAQSGFNYGIQQCIACLWVDPGCRIVYRHRQFYCFLCKAYEHKVFISSPRFFSRRNDICIIC